MFLAILLPCLVTLGAVIAITYTFYLLNGWLFLTVFLLSILAVILTAKFCDRFSSLYDKLDNKFNNKKGE